MIVAHKKDGSTLALTTKTGSWSYAHPDGPLESLASARAAALRVAADGLGADGWTITVPAKDLPQEFNESLASALTVFGVALSVAVPVQVEIAIWDPETDGVTVRHDGRVVWTENSMDRFDQYLRFCAPLGVPVVLSIRADD